MFAWTESDDSSPQPVATVILLYWFLKAAGAGYLPS